MCFAFGEGGKGGGGDNCVRWYETWIQSSGCVSTKTFVWNAIQKEKKRRTIPPTIYKESQVVFFKRKAYKAGSFHFPILASTLVCWFVCPRAKEWVCFLAHAILLIPTHLGNSPLFPLSFFKPSSFFSFSPKYLSHPFCPSCPLARSEVETCVSLHLRGEKGRKVKSDLSPSLSPSLQRGADRLAPSMELSLTPGR